MTTRLTNLIMLILALTAAPTRAQETRAFPLDASFTSAGGTLLFDYPAGWATRETGEVVVLATDPALLDPGAALDFGQMRASITARPIGLMPDLEPDATLDDVLGVLLSLGGDCDAPSAPGTHTINGRAVRRIDRTCGLSEQTFIAVDLDNRLVGVIVGDTLLGTRDKFAATLLQIAGTITLRPPQMVRDFTPEAVITPDTTGLSERFINTDATVRLNHPSGWQVAERGGIIALSDGDGPLFPQPAPDQTIVTVVVYAAADIPADVSQPGAVARWYADNISAQFPFTEPQPFALGTAPAALTRLDTSAVDEIVLAVALENNAYALLRARLGRDQFADYADTIYAIAASLVFNPVGMVSAAASPVPDSAESAEPVEAVESGDALSEAVAAVELTETYTDPDGRFTFGYPDGWRVRQASVGDERFTIMGRGDDFVFDLNPQPGAPDVLIVQSSVSTVTGQPPAADPAQRPVDALAAVLNRQGDDGAAFSAPEALTVLDRPAARSTATFLDTDAAGNPRIVLESGAYLVMIDDDNYAFINAYTVPGERAAIEPDLLAALASFALLPPQVAAAPTVTPTTAPALSATPTVPTVTPATSALDALLDNAEPTATESATVAAPTPPPVVPEASSDDATATFTTPDDAYTFDYPAGWSVSGAGGIVILTSETHRVVLTRVAAAEAGAAAVALSRDESLTAAAITTVSINDRDAALAALDSGETLLVYPLDGETYAVLTVFGPYTEIEAALRALLTSMRAN